MEILKKIARKILADEIKKQEEKAEGYRSLYLSRIKLLEESFKKEEQYSNEIKELKNENAILRQYYDLEKEASDEIKAKMHIDLEINRLKEENLKLIATCISRPPAYDMSYIYPFSRGF